jgi:hypothetical protein
MDNNLMQGRSEKCDMCQGHGAWNHHHWRHVIIKILVALFIFWCGVQFGELKALVHAAYGYQSFGGGMMSWGGRENQAYFQSPVMLYNTSGSVTAHAVMGTTSKAY